MELKLLPVSVITEFEVKLQAKLTINQVVDEIDYCRTLDELKQKLLEAIK